jgi:hypothetical protein
MPAWIKDETLWKKAERGAYESITHKNAKEVSHKEIVDTISKNNRWGLVAYLYENGGGKKKKSSSLNSYNKFKVSGQTTEEEIANTKNYIHDRLKVLEDYISYFKDHYFPQILEAYRNF